MAKLKITRQSAFELVHESPLRVRSIIIPSALHARNIDISLRSPWHFSVKLSVEVTTGWADRRLTMTRPSCNVREKKSEPTSNAYTKAWGLLCVKVALLYVQSLYCELHAKTLDVFVNSTGLWLDVTSKLCVLTSNDRYNCCVRC
jgi:hypothetical protein